MWFHMCSCVLCFLPSASQWANSLVSLQILWSLIFICFPNDYKKQSIVMFCKSLRKMMQYMLSQELQWGNAPEILFFGLHGWNRPYFPFLSKISFPSLQQLYICAFWTSYPLTLLMNSGFWNLYLHVICKIAWTHSFYYGFCQLSSNLCSEDI